LQAQEEARASLERARQIAAEAKKKQSEQNIDGSAAAGDQKESNIECVDNREVKDLTLADSSKKANAGGCKKGSLLS
jgi:predicted nucleotidyltransferase